MQGWWPLSDSPSCLLPAMGPAGDYCNPENANDSWKDRAELVRIAAQKAMQLYPGERAAAMQAIPSDAVPPCCYACLLRHRTRSTAAGLGGNEHVCRQ